MTTTSKLLIITLTTLLLIGINYTLKAQSEYFDKDYGTDGIATIDLPLDFSLISNRDFTVNFDSLGRTYISHFIASGGTRKILRLDTLGHIDVSFGTDGYLWESDFKSLHKDNYIFFTSFVDFSTLIIVMDLDSNLLLRVTIPDLVDINNLSYEDEGFLVGITNNAVCFRYNSEGLLDTNFGEAGLVNPLELPSTILLLTMSTRLIKDKSSNAYFIYYFSPYIDADFGVSKIDSSGLAEHYFKEDLFPTFFMDNSIQSLTNLTLHDDNSLIVSGKVYWADPEEDSFYLKLKSDKTIDTDFGEDGLIWLPNSSDNNEPSKAIIGQFSNSNLVVIGKESVSPETYKITDFSLLSQNGQLLEAFGNEGLIQLDDIPGNNKLTATIYDNSLYLMSYDDTNLRQIHLTKINPFDNETSISKPETPTSNHLSLYPNPAHLYTQWLYTGPTLGPTRLAISDNQGQLIKTTNLPSLIKDSVLPIDTKDLPEGTYLIQLAQEDQIVLTGKLVVQH